MLRVTRDMMLPTAITGSYPRPLWYDQNLAGRSFKAALGDSMFREQYQDAVAAIINAQEAAGLDIVTDGDSRFDLAVGGKSWFFYPIERLGGLGGHQDTSRGWMQRHDLRPGKILWEVQEAYQPAVVKEKLTRGPLEYAALWKVAQRLTDKPVKFGAICAPALASMLWDEHYRDDRGLINDLSDIMNAEFRDLAAAGCPLIQVEEPPHHGRTTRPDCKDADLEFFTQAFNRQLTGVDTEIWVHTCWGNPNQQRVYWQTPSYERALPQLLQLDADVITFECASTGGMDLPLFAKYRTDKKIGIGVISHCNSGTARARGRPHPESARVHPARAPRDYHRLRLRPRGAEPTDRLLQVRRPRRRHQSRSSRAGPARGPRARERCSPLVRGLTRGPTRPHRGTYRAEAARINDETAGAPSVTNHQGLAQGVRLQLELVNPILDHVPDTHDAREPALVDHGEVADAVAGHERHDGGDPIARRARMHARRHHPGDGKREHVRVVLDQSAHDVAFRDDANDAAAVLAYHHEGADVPALELPGHRVERRVRARGFHVVTLYLEDCGNGHETPPSLLASRAPGAERCVDIAAIRRRASTAASALA